MSDPTFGTCGSPENQLLELATNAAQAPRRHRDAGFALPISIFALVVMAILITGTFHVSRQESRIAVATEQSSIAFYLAERGITDVVADWNPAAFGGAPLWGSVSVSDTIDEGFWEVDVTRLGNRLFFLDGTGTVTRGGVMLSGASRRIGLMARILSADIDPPAALVTRGQTDVRGTAEVHGEDTDPGAWGGYCSGAPTDKPGIMTNDSSHVDTQGQGEITGSPPVETDPTISDETFTQFGDMTWDDLISLANKTYLGGNFNQTWPSLLGDGSCNTGDPLNWGDPNNPGSACGSYFPIIYVNGTARMQSGGVGQGILLVEGDLDLRGGFTFHGVIIVQGSFETQGSGNRVFGGVYASNADFDNQSLVGGSVIQNSTCAVQRAVLNNPGLTQARPLAERSWIDLSSVVN